MGNIPDEVYREGYVNSVLREVTILEMFEELKRRGVDPDKFMAWDYATDQMADAMTTAQEHSLRGGNVKEVL